MEQDTDRPGGSDYGHLVPVKADPALCQKACQAVAQCKTWTYTIQGSAPNRWLKQSAPPPQHNTCCVSGIK